MKNRRTFNKLFVFLLVSLLLIFPKDRGFAQVPITSGFIYTQNFDSLGTSATATLPAYWRVDKNATARTLGTYAGAVTATELRAGNNMSSSAGNGIYNYGAGDPAMAPDRAIGWISSTNGTKSGNLYLYMQNNTGNDLSSVWISYDVEKYRMGSNAAGFSIQMYYSPDGTTWTSAGSSFLTSFAGGDASNNGYASAPGAAVTLISKPLILGSPISAGGSLYLAWNYSVTSGTTTSNAQALGLDNFVISENAITNHTITFDGTINTSSEWDADSELLGTATANYYITWDSTYLYAAIIGGDTTNDKYNLLIDIDPDDTGVANSGTTTNFCGATFGGDGKPDYAVQKYPGGVARVDGTSGSWTGWTPAGGTDAVSGTNQTEFRVQWSDIGVNTRTTPVAVYLYTCNNGNLVWSAWPPENPQWTGSTQELPSRTYLPTTDSGHFPRTYGQHRGDQTQFDANGSFSLLGGFAQINITSGGGTGCAFRVDMRGNAVANVNDNAVRRLYTLTPSGCAPTADITLKYLDGTDYGAVGELNGHTESSLVLYRWNGTTWVNEGGTVNTTNNTVYRGGVNTFSPWTFADTDAPTALTLTHFTTHTLITPWLLALLTLALLGLTGLMWARKRLHG